MCVHVCVCVPACVFTALAHFGRFIKVKVFPAGSSPLVGEGEH